MARATLTRARKAGRIRTPAVSFFLYLAFFKVKNALECCGSMPRRRRARLLLCYPFNPSS
eukprot:2878758-Prymnesium_polylepis.1